MRRFVPGAVVLLTLLNAGLAPGEEKIPVNMSAWPVGATAHFLETPGDMVTETYLGLEDGLHKFRKTFTLSHNRGVANEYLWRTDNFELVREQNLNGDIRRIDPHNCARTLGVCTMTSQLGSDRPYTATSTIEQTEDGYSGVFSINDQAAEYSFTVDANGFLLSTHAVADDGTVYGSQRVKLE
ncbi:MAG: hypothetical protein AAGH68_06395 [Pseudomonadota bacterium]